MVTAQQDEYQRTVDAVDEGLDLVLGRVPGIRKGLDGADVRCRNLLGGIGPDAVLDRLKCGCCTLDIGGVVAPPALDNVVLAGR